MNTDEYAGQGGSYRVEADGRLVRVEAPTQDHPQGNRPRDAQGRPLDVPAEISAAEVPAAEPQPKSARRGIASVLFPASTEVKE